MEVKINREIRNYTESMFFGLSMRQFVFSILAILVAVGLYFLLKPHFGTETVSWMCILGAAPFAALGFITYHGMTAEQLFADLCKYESEDFYQEHKAIRFDTLSGFGEYEIVAVFKTIAYSEQGFKYYHFTRAESAEDFDTYIAQCKALSLYDTGVTVESGDKLITLSTCEYSRKNGRMVVVAKRIAAPSAEVGNDA